MDTGLPPRGCGQKPSQPYYSYFPFSVSLPHVSSPITQHTCMHAPGDVAVGSSPKSPRYQQNKEAHKSHVFSNGLKLKKFLFLVFRRLLGKSRPECGTRDSNSSSNIKEYFSLDKSLSWHCHRERLWSALLATTCGQHNIVFCQLCLWLLSANQAVARHSLLM